MYRCADCDQSALPWAFGGDSPSIAKMLAAIAEAVSIVVVMRIAGSAQCAISNLRISATRTRQYSP